MQKLILLVIPAMCLLVACAPSAETDEPAPAVTTADVTTTISTATAFPPAVVPSTITAATQPSATATAFPTTVPTTPTAIAADLSIDDATSITYGRTDDGAFFHGDPNAPVTLIDYSDFL